MYNKNFPTNPKRGGIPANDSNIIKTLVRRKYEVCKFLNLFNVLYDRSQTDKRTENKPRLKIRYKPILQIINAKPQSTNPSYPTTYIHE